LYVDVGAHVGNHTIAFLLMGAAAVVAFEPQPELYALLGVNTVLNGMRRRVLGKRLVVHDSWKGAAVSSTTPRNSGATRFGPDGVCAYPTGTLDVQLAEARHVALIKVDVEGLELAVLRSGRKVIERCKPVVVCEAQDDGRRAELDALLRPLGYWSDGRARCATPTYVWLPRG
jgi:FkbM family methyltransferase